MARPKKEINWSEVELRLEAGNSVKIIASCFNIDTDTFYIRFKEQYGCSFQDYPAKYGNFRDKGKENIAAAQYKVAMKGSNNMLIHLGREWLDQGKEEEVKKVPHQESLSMLHRLMLIEAELAQTKEELNAYRDKDKPKTEQIVPGSDSQV